MKKNLLFLFLLPLISIYSQNIDINILKNINLNRNRNLDGTFRVITNTVTPIAITTPVLICGIGFIKKDSEIKYQALVIGASVFSAAVVSTVLKHSVNRTRPFINYPFIEQATRAGSPSFPSGHTSDAFALATSLSVTYPEWYVILPAYAWAGTVGFSRMDLGVHYPSDVLMGAIIGGGSAYLCFKGRQWLNRRQKNKPELQ